MAVVYRDSETDTSSGATTVTLTRPDGAQYGDLMLAALAFAGGSNVTITPPSGWELVLRTNDTTVGGVAVYQKRYVATDTATSYAFTLSTSSAHASALLVYGGADQVRAVDISGGQANASSANCVAPSVTTTVSNALLVKLASAAAGTVTATPPAGFTERVDTTGGAVSLAVSDDDQTTLGASGTKTTVLSSAQANIGQLVALAPSQLNTYTQVRDEGNWDLEGWSNRFTTEAAMNTFVDTTTQRENSRLRQRVGIAWYAENLLSDPWLTLLSQAEMDMVQASMLRTAAQIAETGSDTNPAPFLGGAAAIRDAAYHRERSAEGIIQMTRGSGNPGPRGPYFVSSSGAAAIRPRFDREDGLEEEE